MRINKFIFSIILVLFLCYISCFNSNLIAKADSNAEIVVEVETGQILYANNEKSRLPMASTTKIMTAIIIVEDCDLNAVIKVPKEAVGVEGSSIYLKCDEEISIKDLLFGLMLRSGNDASVALAIAHSGSVEKFVDVMNERAKAIGASDTHFCNPNGLPNDMHYTTAHDLAKIGAYAMKNATFREIVSTKSYKGDYKYFANKNKILNMLDGANGVKTGYTKKAGRCLVSSAKRDDMQLVCVVLNCPDMYERSKKLLENAFERYSTVKIGKDKKFEYKNNIYCVGESVSLVVRKNAVLRYEIEICGDGKRDELPLLKIYDENNLIFSQNLYTIIDD